MIRRPARDRPVFAETWIENWPKGLAELSFAQAGVQLERPEMLALGRANGIFPHLFEASAPGTLARLEHRLDAATRQFPDGAFIRLGSRSPKDTMLGVLTGCRAENGAAALRLLTNRSRRVAFDLRCCLEADYSPWIFAREWHEIPMAAEYRCFMRSSRLIGVSQYHTGIITARHGSETASRQLTAEIRDFFALFSRCCPLEAVVVDVATGLGEPEAVRLIELNPFDPLTEACLFSWHASDFDGTLRRVGPRGVVAMTLDT